jgi:hypothetical protein
LIIVKSSGCCIVHARFSCYLAALYI